MKKRIMLGIFILLIIILGVFLYNINNKKISKDNFIKLINNFKNVSNVKLESSTTSKYIKNEKMLSIRADGIYFWSNSNTKECIAYSPKYKTYSFIEYNEENTSFEEMVYKFMRIQKV